MELIIKGFLFNDENLTEFNIKVTGKNYKIVYLKLKLEHLKIVNYIKKLKEKGMIKSIFIPKNKKMQKDLNKLIKVKKEIKLNLSKIKLFFK